MNSDKNPTLVAEVRPDYTLTPHNPYLSANYWEKQYNATEEEIEGTIKELGDKHGRPSSIPELIKWHEQKVATLRERSIS